MALELETLDMLARLEREMAAANRTAESEALRRALENLVRPDNGFLPLGQAAEQLLISVPMAEYFIERGALKGIQLGSRWFVTRESVDRILDIRKASAALDEEGTPTIEDILRLRKRRRRPEDEAEVA